MSDNVVKRREGRPSVWENPETVQLLEEAFKLGAPDITAIKYAGISPVTYYAKIKIDEEFSNRMNRAQQYAIIKARSNVIKAVEKGDLDTSKWFIEKHNLPKEQTQSTQVNVFNVLREKYAMKNGVVQTEEPIVPVETNE